MYLSHLLAIVLKRKVMMPQQIIRLEIRGFMSE
jgi:hypothetical protein